MTRFFLAILSVVNGFHFKKSSCFDNYSTKRPMMPILQLSTFRHSYNRFHAMQISQQKAPWRTVHGDYSETSRSRRTIDIPLPSRTTVLDPHRGALSSGNLAVKPARAAFVLTTKSSEKEAQMEVRLSPMHRA
jgi:hypothetical protein